MTNFTRRRIWYFWPTWPWSYHRNHNISPWVKSMMVENSKNHQLSVQVKNNIVIWVIIIKFVIEWKSWWSKTVKTINFLFEWYLWWSYQKTKLSNFFLNETLHGHVGQKNRISIRMKSMIIKNGEMGFRVVSMMVYMDHK